MFYIYETLIIVITSFEYTIISHMKNQHGIIVGLDLTPSQEGPGK
jgi:hypothetical protein